MEHLKKYFLLYTITPLAILTISASFYRYMILEDFFVTYEIACNPQTASCFIGCEDDECTEEYYFSLVTRHTNDISLLCGEDITDCEAALSCGVNEATCQVIYCDQTDELAQCASNEPKTTS